MTMSVGLARIVSDPDATTLTRKALGALSTPGLLCYDDGLSIDDTGRFVIKLKSGGKIKQDADGLSLEITIGIDSHVDLVSDEYDREWNMQITGTAPNFIESRVDIGQRNPVAESPALTRVGDFVEPSKVTIKNDGTQLRLMNNERNFVSQRCLTGGHFEVWSVGSTPGIHFITITEDGDAYNVSTTWGSDSGIRINGGSVITQIAKLKFLVTFPGGGVAGAMSFYEATYPIINGLVRDDRDHVTVVPLDGIAIPAEFITWNAYFDFAGHLVFRLTWFGVTAAENRYWQVMITKFKDIDY